MSDFMMVLLVAGGVFWFLFGVITATTDISNKEIVLPGDLKSDGYNLFGSWTIFILRSAAALPFWVLGTLSYLVYMGILWLFTVGGKKS